MAKTELFVRKTSGGVYVVNPESQTTGNIYFVDSGSSTGGTSAGYGSNPDAPFTTIDSAINQTTANNGDIIYVMAGHSETLTGASAITCDVAGVTIIGLGRGTDRPTLLLDAGASVSIAISAANVRWENVVFSAGHADITVAIDVSATNAEFDRCEWKENTTFSHRTFAALITIETDAPPSSSKVGLAVPLPSPIMVPRLHHK